MHLVDLSLLIILNFRSWIFIEFWESYVDLNSDEWNLLCLIRLIQLELGQINVVLLMSDESWIEWYMYDEFLWGLDHDDEEQDEHAMNTRVLVLQIAFDLSWAVFACILLFVSHVPITARHIT